MYEEYDSRRLLKSTKRGDKSRTIIIPSDSGPNASIRVEKGTVPEIYS